MISIYQLKPKFQALLRPILDALHRKGITANQITLFSILWSLLIAVLFWLADQHHWFYLSLPIGLLVRMALNALDGMMARVYKQQSKKGEVLNELGDIVSDVAIFMPLLKYEHRAVYAVVLFICLSIINEFAGILAKAVSGERRYDGPMGKSDRAFLMGLYGIIGFVGLNSSAYSLYVLLFVSLLLVVSTYLRIKKSIQ